MTYGSSTNDERFDGAADARRPDGTTRTDSTDDSTRPAAVRSEASERTGATPAPESAAGPRPSHAPRTPGAGSPAGVKAAPEKTAPEKDAEAERPVQNSTATADESLAPRSDRDFGTSRPDRSGTADADRTGPLGANAGADRTRADDAGTRRGTTGTSASAAKGVDHDRALLAGTDHDELEGRMRHAVSDFVEDPQRAVREAGATLDAVTENLVKALAERSTALRAEEGPDGADGRNGERTEQLRIVLQHYRDLTDRLLAV
ncbi:hypothetical protein [Streptomyces sp. NBC_00102]|uniref:hypothetical protein n=1 Tax=Streptomyces sp. NBC_00102 TaxID=2975652 RepID=UPI00225A0A31|nr:hypothetical protein [Streptomyces sp. NBC_00102]MCX5401409.1 hypothetical protein [Streptomyces sp. NBC_00102]